MTHKKLGLRVGEHRERTLALPHCYPPLVYQASQE